MSYRRPTLCSPRQSLNRLTSSHTQKTLNSQTHQATNPSNPIKFNQIKCQFQNLCFSNPQSNWIWWSSSSGCFFCLFKFKILAVKKAQRKLQSYLLACLPFRVRLYSGFAVFWRWKEGLWVFLVIEFGRLNLEIHFYLKFR